MLALSFNLPGVTLKVLTISVLFGTPTLSLLATFGSAITLSLHRGGLLLAILILPLYIPVLVLGASAGVLSIQGVSCIGHLSLLAAIAIGAVLLLPLAISAAIKVSSS